MFRLGLHPRNAYAKFQDLKTPETGNPAETQALSMRATDVCLHSRIDCLQQERRGSMGL
jgi:hypothetical protein